MGLAMRGWAQGWSIGVVQFVNLSVIPATEDPDHVIVNRITSNLLQQLPNPFKTARLIAAIHQVTQQGGVVRSPLKKPLQLTHRFFIQRDRLIGAGSVNIRRQRHRRVNPQSNLEPQFVRRTSQPPAVHVTAVGE